MHAIEVSDPATHQAAPLSPVESPSASPSAPPSALPSILSRLQQETRCEHEAVEEVLDLMAKSLTRVGYARRLEQFYGFYAPIEEALRARRDAVTDHAGAGVLSIGIHEALATRLSKTAHLRQDLHGLGFIPEDLPLCLALPPLRTQSEVLGCLYVLEGATLGGRLITQHVCATLGITPTTGGSFFEGYGAGTGKMWQAMRQLLVIGAPDMQSQNAIIANAVATFAALRCWCQSVQQPITTQATRHA